MSYPGRILAVDYGTKRVGVAVSDPTRLIASGVATLMNDGHLLEKLRTMVCEQGVVRIVVGMPYGPDGSRGRAAERVDRFIETLRGSVDVAIETWDESYSSVSAKQIFLETGMKRKRRQEKERVDEMAARILLQEYLDHNNDARPHSI